MSLTWILFRYPGLWDKFDIDCILGKGDQLFQCIQKFRYLSIEDLPQDLLIENVATNVEFLENKSGEMTAEAYLISITEIVNSAQPIKTGALLIVNNYILYLIWGSDLYIYLIIIVKKE